MLVRYQGCRVYTIAFNDVEQEFIDSLTATENQTYESALKKFLLEAFARAKKIK